jgi:hypothetical protein
MRIGVNCLSKTKIWVQIHRLVGTFFCGKFSFYEKDNPTCSLPFNLLNIKKQHTKSIIGMGLSLNENTH